jgi:hypothetical protein
MLVRLGQLEKSSYPPPCSPGWPASPCTRQWPLTFQSQFSHPGQLVFSWINLHAQVTEFCFKNRPPYGRKIHRIFHRKNYILKRQMAIISTIFGTTALFSPTYFCLRFGLQTLHRWLFFKKWPVALVVTCEVTIFKRHFLFKTHPLSLCISYL